MNCKASHKIWKATIFAAELNLFVNQDILSIVQTLTVKKGRAEMEMSAAICWVNWHSRNLFIFEGKTEDSQVSLAKVEALVESFRKIKPPPLPSSRRQPNLAGCFKLNVDAATQRQNQVAGLGAIIKDSKGNFVAATQKQESFNGDVTAAEARAIRLGMEIAENAGCMPLIIESDCEVAVNLVIGKKCSKA